MNYEGLWLRITKCENIPLREGRAVRLGKREIAIFNLGDRFLAIENRCPHQGGPLSDGMVSGSNVVCPLHAWKVCLEDGTVKRPMDVAKCVETFPVRMENDTIMVRIPAAWGIVRCEEDLVALSANEHSRSNMGELSA